MTGSSISAGEPLSRVEAEKQDPHRRAVGAVYVLTYCAFLLLSRVLLVAPETVVTLRNNVLFGSDTGSRFRYLAVPGARPITMLEFGQHPAFFLVLKPLVQAVEVLLSPMVAEPARSVLAVQLLVCALAATAATGIYVIALRWRLSQAIAFPTTLLFVLSTSSVLLVVPEHWALGVAAMVLCFHFATRAEAPSRKDIAIVLMLATLAVATTITNAVFAVMAVTVLLVRSHRPRLLRYFLGVAAITALLGAVLGVGLIRSPGVSGFFNNRLLDAPSDALRYGAFGFVGPILGPVPHQSTFRDHVSITYEPFSFGLYGAVHWIGIIAWVGLLWACAWKSFVEWEARRLVFWLVAWILFNIIFHNIWGDEFFLYSPHWAWALFGIIILGARRLPPLAVSLGAIGIAVDQCYTLWVVAQLLRSG